MSEVSPNAVVGDLGDRLSPAIFIDSGAEEGTGTGPDTEDGVLIGRYTFLEVAAMPLALVDRDIIPVGVGWVVAACNESATDRVARW